MLNNRLDDNTTFTTDVLGIGQANSTSNGNNWYTRDPNSGAILVEHCASGDYYFLFDGLGSVVAVTDSTGSVVRTFKYDPYGNLVSSTGTLFEPIRYAGYYFDYQTSLYKAGARYYNPKTSRWTQTDAIDNPLDQHGWNQYDYAGNDPINFVDPSGTFGLSDFGHAVLGAYEIADSFIVAGAAVGLGVGCPVLGAAEGGVVGGVLAAQFCLPAAGAAAYAAQIEFRSGVHEISSSF